MLYHRMPDRDRYAREPMLRAPLRLISRRSLAPALALAAVAALSFAACAPPGDSTGDDDDSSLPDLPSASQISDAKARLQASLAGASEIRKVLERLGILPTYTCGEPRNTFVGQAVGSMQARYGCATVALDASNPTRDVVTVTFPPGGCDVGGTPFAGSMVARISGGDDTFALELDPRNLSVGGKTLTALGGYGSCGDASRYWASATGTAYGRAFTVDALVEKRAGTPFLSSTMLAVDGALTLTDASGTDSVTLDGVEYEVGDTFPHAGTIVVETAAGHRISATFSTSSRFTGSVRLVIDAHDAVVIPIPA